MADMTKTGIVFDTQSFSVHDGPGIRTLVFLKGCPLSCLWCANPEGQSIHPEIRYHETNCAGCLSCVAACPHAAAHPVVDRQPKQGFVKFQRETCLKCQEKPCIEACPNRALQLVGKTMTVGDVMKVIRRDLPYSRGVGGVTLSGGEPLMQFDFAMEILKACREEYVSTAVESAMHVPWERVETAMPYVDLFLCDIKQMDSDRHRELTKVGNEQILANIAALAKAKPTGVLVRVPVIPTMNDSLKNIGATAAFARANGIDRINLLPYHKMGEVKYRQIGIDYPMPDLPSPSADQMAELKQAVEAQGVKCIVG